MTNRSRYLKYVGLLLLLTLLWWVFIDRIPSPPTTDTDFKLSRLMGSGQSSQGFHQAKSGTVLQFPEDHGQHPQFQNEWWYLTGHLHDRADPKREFGFQFTQFRFALAPPGQAETPPTDSTNPWLSPQFYMSHFALTHVEANQHRASERFSRQGPGLAGTESPAEVQPLRIWLADWSLQSQTTGDLFPLTLIARDQAQKIGLKLTATTLKPRVLQGDAGFSLKNREGGASYYYSYPRLKVEGHLQWQDREYQVQGLAWFDHEWSSNSLAEYQAGWDWFSLQLTDGRDLMYYRFRNQDGSTGLSHVLLVDQDGRAVPLASKDVTVDVLEHWRSEDGVDYPSSWRMRIPSQGLDLRIEPQVKQQLMALSVRYWEGAVRVGGSHQGRGYVELAGYE